MAKKAPEPVIAQVPWNVPDPAQVPDEPGNVMDDSNLDDLAAAIFNQPETTAEPSDIERARASFAGEPVKQRSPFAPAPKAPEVEEKPVYEMGDAPTWAEFVNFIRAHGNLIHRARYPQPRGECIDTMWKGVTVLAHPTCEIQHVQYGWVSWDDAQYR
jgi:hypothetical protein